MHIEHVRSSVNKCTAILETTATSQPAANTWSDFILFAGLLCRFASIKGRFRSVQTTRLINKRCCCVRCKNCRFSSELDIYDDEPEAFPYKQSTFEEIRFVKPTQTCKQKTSSVK